MCILHTHMYYNMYSYCTHTVHNNKICTTDDIYTILELTFINSAHLSLFNGPDPGSFSES